MKFGMKKAIETHLISIINRFGNRCQYAQYILKEDNNE